MLELDPQVVHDRAHAGLAVLAPALARGVPEGLREQVGDYLLGQAGAEQAAATRGALAASAPAREWAKALAVELVHVTADPLPEIPAADVSAGGDAPRVAAAGATAVGGAGASGATFGDPLSRIARETDAGADAAVAGSGGESRPSVSRRGGFVVLGVIAIVVAVAIVLVVTSGKGSGSSEGGRQAAQTQGAGSGAEGSSGEGAGTETGSTGESGGEGAGSGGSKTKAKYEAEVVLSAAGGSKATGAAIFASVKGKHEFILAAEHLQPPSGFKYVAWLIGGSGEATPLGLAEVNSEGKIIAGNQLPEQYPRSGHFELTRNTGSKPSHPGEVVLEGSYELK